MKKKETKQISAWLSLVAILSVIAVFFLVCFGVMFVLNRLGVYELPKLFNKNNDDTLESGELVQNIEDVSVDFVLHTNNKEFYEKLIRKIPIQNNFYLQADVTTFSNDESVIYHYWIWRYGSKYRMAILNNENYDLVKMIICDGENVKVEFVETNQIEYHKIDEGYSFLQQTPIIDFSFLDEDDFGYIEKINGNNDRIDYTIQYTLINEVINISLDTNEYIPIEYKIERNGQKLVEYKLLNYENVDYFTNEQFNIE